MENTVKVLIAEDEPHALMGLAELISGWGYRTETARDGMEAWEKALAWDPAIVVTDLKMPRLDGLGLLSKLAEEGNGLSGNVAVVLLTTFAQCFANIGAMVKEVGAKSAVLVVVSIYVLSFAWTGAVHGLLVLAARVVPL